MDKIYKWVALGLMVVLLALAGYGYFVIRAKDKENAKLRDEIASKDVTIQTKDGAYTKLSREVDDLKATNAELQKTIDKAKQDVITAQLASLTWKKKYEDLLKIVPNPFPGTGWDPVKPARCTDKPGEFFAEKDYGLVKSRCTILTYDPDTQLKLALEGGSRPLKLNLAVTRDQDKQWHSYVKVEPPDDQNMSVDIVTSSYNIEPLSEKWYEKLSVHLDVGAGGTGVLGGLGAAYRFGQFNLGPSIWGVTSGNGGGAFYGINFSWSPFKSTSP